MLKTHASTPVVSTWSLLERLNLIMNSLPTNSMVRRVILKSEGDLAQESC